MLLVSREGDNMMFRHFRAHIKDETHPAYSSKDSYVLVSRHPKEFSS